MRPLRFPPPWIGRRRRLRRPYGSPRRPLDSPPPPLATPRGPRTARELLRSTASSESSASPSMAVLTSADVMVGRAGQAGLLAGPGCSAARLALFFFTLSLFSFFFLSVFILLFYKIFYNLQNTTPNKQFLKIKMFISNASGPFPIYLKSTA